MAVSPRAKTDLAFREQMVNYLAECAVTKDLDPRQAPLDARMAQLVASLAAHSHARAAPGGWRAGSGRMPSCSNSK